MLFRILENASVDPASPSRSSRRVVEKGPDGIVTSIITIGPVTPKYKKRALLDAVCQQYLDHLQIVQEHLSILRLRLRRHRPLAQTHKLPDIGAPGLIQVHVHVRCLAAHGVKEPCPENVQMEVPKLFL